MRTSLEMIKTATRVLSALTDGQQPETTDVEALRDFDMGTENGRDIETLACDVVQKALRRRAELRGQKNKDIDQLWMTG